MVDPTLVKEIGPSLRPDPTRVVIRPFVPGDDPTVADPARRSRIGRIIARIAELDEETCQRELQRILASLAGRHANVDQILRRRYHDLICPPVTSNAAVSEERALLIGAFLSAEYSFETAALFNPSIVQHPEPSRIVGAARFILSLLRTPAIKGAIQRPVPPG
ncbi:MAG: hypothetical protein AB7G25_06005 [Sphingomonadaceae bacterium]